MNQHDFGDVLPGLEGMATFASGAERAVMNVFVAGSAFALNADEFERGVALRAGQGRMLALQWKAGGFVLEFQIQPQRRPVLGGMAITARNFDFAVRMAHGCNLGLCRFEQSRNQET